VGGGGGVRDECVGMVWGGGGRGKGGDECMGMVCGGRGRDKGMSVWG